MNTSTMIGKCKEGELLFHQLSFEFILNYNGESGYIACQRECKNKLPKFETIEICIYTISNSKFNMYLHSSFIEILQYARVILDLFQYTYANMFWLLKG